MFNCFKIPTFLNLFVQDITTHIVTLYDIVDTKSKLYLVTDLCTGGELFDRIVSRGSFTEKDAASVVKQVASGLVYIHSKDIVYRDVKVCSKKLKR